MKLLFCPDCNHIFSLSHHMRSCDCGKVSGRYVDNVTAEVNGNGYSLAIGNGSLRDAIMGMARGKKHQDNGVTGIDRDYFKDHCRVEYCWVRPHEGDGNPHTRVNPRP